MPFCLQERNNVIRNLVSDLLDLTEPGGHGVVREVFYRRGSLMYSGLLPYGTMEVTDEPHVYVIIQRWQNQYSQVTPAIMYKSGDLALMGFSDQNDSVIDWTDRLSSRLTALVVSHLYDGEPPEMSAPAPFPPTPSSGERIAEGINFPGVGKCDVWLTEDVTATDFQSQNGLIEEFARVYSPNLCKHIYCMGQYNADREYVPVMAIQIRVRPGSEEAEVIQTVLRMLIDLH